MSTDEHSGGEDEAPSDSASATSRATGGRDPGDGDEDSQDQNSTTGTTSNDKFVGRASGDEAGDVEGSGGERRSGRPEDAHDGALRDE